MIVSYPIQYLICVISELALLLQNPFLLDFEQVGDDINKRHLWSALHLKNRTECLRRKGICLLIGYSLGCVVALLRIHLWLFESAYFSVKNPSLILEQMIN